jgi:hypothetical protein
MLRGSIPTIKPHVVGRWLAAQIRARPVWYRVRGAERVHGHQPRDQTAFRNLDRDLVGKLAVDATLGCYPHPKVEEGRWIWLCWQNSIFEVRG